MADLREDFVTYVVKALVSNPDGVELKRATDEKGDYLELTVDPGDMGKVIGKAGATAKSLRTLLRSVGAKDGLEPLPLKIVDPEGHVGPKRQEEQTVAPETPAEEQAAPEEEEVPEDVEEPRDEHSDLHERTKREAQELADLEI